jgi:MYND finger/Ankyrin repeat
LEKTERPYGYSSIFHVIRGALATHHSQFYEHTGCFIGAAQNYEACLKHLLDMGADVESRDGEGYTPLHMCVRLVVTPLTFRLGRLLLERGANPNAKDRNDVVPLSHAYVQRSEDFLLLLLEFGAEPGVSLLGFNPSVMFRRFPRVVKACEERIQRFCQQLRQEAKEAGRFKACVVCNANSKHCKRCSGCFLVWYCGVACQTLDWAKHNATCRMTRAQYKPVVIEPVKSTDKLSIEEVCITSVVLPKEECTEPRKNHFVVKVQKLADVNFKLAINNKERSICGRILCEENPDLSAVLKSKIEESGVYGNVAFFQAVWNSENGLKINPFVVLPPEVW